MDVKTQTASCKLTSLEALVWEYLGYNVHDGEATRSQVGTIGSQEDGTHNHEGNSSDRTPFTCTAIIRLCMEMQIMHIAYMHGRQIGCSAMLSQL